LIDLKNISCEININTFPMIGFSQEMSQQRSIASQELLGGGNTKN
jgi:hypothetical protein